MSFPPPPVQSSNRDVFSHSGLPEEERLDLAVQSSPGDAFSNSGVYTQRSLPSALMLMLAGEEKNFASQGVTDAEVKEARGEFNALMKRAEAEREAEREAEIKKDIRERALRIYLDTTRRRLSSRR